MATKDGLAQIWYADANGVITGNTQSADNVASAIIDGYNEHFGTDINIWTPETKTLQVGDTVPSWSAYEKIGLPGLVYINVQSGTGLSTSFAGFILDNIFHWYSQNNGTKILLVSNNPNNNGTIITLLDWRQDMQNDVYQTIRNNYPNIDNIEKFDVEWTQGDIVPNWENYTYIAR